MFEVLRRIARGQMPYLGIFFETQLLNIGFSDSDSHFAIVWNFYFPPLQVYWMWGRFPTPWDEDFDLPF